MNSYENDIHQKLLITYKYFNEALNQNQITESTKILNNMKIMHGKHIKEYLKYLSSDDPDDLINLSDLYILSGKMNKTIRKASKKLIRVTNKLEQKDFDEKKEETAKTVLSDVFELDKLNKKVPSLILFYAEWCGHCKSLLPVWDLLIKNNNTDVIDVVKCSCVKNKDVCNKMDAIRGYPTILLYLPTSNKYIPYEGNRNYEDIVEFVKSQTSIRMK